MSYEFIWFMNIQTPELISHVHTEIFQKGKKLTWASTELELPLITRNAMEHAAAIPFHNDKEEVFESNFILAEIRMIKRKVLVWYSSENKKTFVCEFL